MNTMTPGQQNTFHEVTRWMKYPPSHIIGDVTARDGIQAVPWYHMPSKENRASIAKKMIQAGIPHIEIGFPVMDGDSETLAVRHVVEQTRDLAGGIFVLARLNEQDIEQCTRVLDGARHGGIHTFIGTSPEHRESLSMSQEQILQNIGPRIKQIRDAGYMAEFSAEDATRTEDDFLKRVYTEAVSAGAQILNVPDTVGYSDVDDYLAKIDTVRSVSGDAIISTHCHNDMGFGEASPIMAIRRGLAQRVEGTIFGIGARTGNTDITSLIITLSSHPTYGQHVSDLIRNGESLADIIELVQDATGYTSRPIQPGYGFDAIVNRSGVHQAKVANMKNSYVWIDPAGFGLIDRDTIDVGPLSGKAGIEYILKEMNVTYQDSDVIKLTALIRAIFSPDTSITDIEKMFPEISEDKINKLSNTVKGIRMEARTLVPTVKKQKQWRGETRTIIRDAVRYFYGD